MIRNVRITFSLLFLKSLIVGLLFATLSALAYAQTFQTGIPPFATVGGGPDDINLGDNSVHWTFPVFNKTGRGISASFPLVRDTQGGFKVRRPTAHSGFRFWGITFQVLLVSDIHL
jgi:hypothetical protein